MKAVLLSIQPKWCELIASGKKTVEIRKTKPKIQVPFKVYIYCTQEKRLLHKFNKGEKIDDETFFEEHVFVRQNTWIRGHFNPNGKVIGEFVCDSIANYEAELWDDKTFERIQEFYEPDDFAEYGEYEFKTIADNSDDFWKENMLCKASCVSIPELRKYIGRGINNFYGWHISDLVIYNKPRELGEFERACPNNVRSCAMCRHSGYSAMKCLPITKPPQSWCYVEGVN